MSRKMIDEMRDIADEVVRMADEIEGKITCETSYENSYSPEACKFLRLTLCASKVCEGDEYLAINLALVALQDGDLNGDTRGTAIDTLKHFVAKADKASERQAVEQPV